MENKEYVIVKTIQYVYECSVTEIARHTLSKKDYLTAIKDRERSFCNSTKSLKARGIDYGVDKELIIEDGQDSYSSDVINIMYWEGDVWITNADYRYTMISLHVVEKSKYQNGWTNPAKPSPTGKNRYK